MPSSYNHKDIEKKWQKTWQDEQLYVFDENKGKKEDAFYCLVEFPYPSGNLHVGHWYAFGVTDIYARYMRMQGKNVLFPIGFDAFGLPAENAAIKHGINPREWTQKNMDYMTGQLKNMGSMFDWSRQVATCHPDYYKWTQWLFVQFLKKGIIYQSEGMVNWCPSCKTVLANEQVNAGKCDRCDSEIEQRKMNEWKMRITDYADALIDDLEDLDWPHAIKQAQRNWIGKSEGAKIPFVLQSGKESQKIEVFTTRPDTLYGVTYVVVAPEHDLVKYWLDNNLIKNQKVVTEYIDTVAKQTERDRMVAAGKEKTGVELEGITAKHPLTGEMVPVWIADYVLASYGTGCVMAVPAHDERDFEFAKKFDLPIKQVIAPETGELRKDEVFSDGGCGVVFDPETQKYAMAEWSDGRLNFFAGGPEPEDVTIRDTILREVVEESGLHDFKEDHFICTTYPHYYHTAKKLNRVARAEAHLLILESRDTREVQLMDHEQFVLVWKDADEIREKWESMNQDGGYTHYLMSLRHGVAKAIELGYDKTSDTEIYKEESITGYGILENSGDFTGKQSTGIMQEITEAAGGAWTATYRLRDWSVSRQRYWGCPIPVVYCDECGVVPEVEENLPVILPDVNDYMPSDSGESPLAKATGWVATKCPQCHEEARRETDTLDTFVDSSWYFLRYLDPQNTEALAEQGRLEQGMPVDFYSGGAEHTTMHLLYSRFFVKAINDVTDFEIPNEPYARRLNRGIILGPDGNKMSKSKGNVIDPDNLIEKVGADTIRAYLAFIGPYNEVGHYPWDPNGVVGVRRFLEKVWRLYKKVEPDTTASDEINRIVHRTIAETTKAYGILKFNTGIAQLMTLVNILEKEESISQDTYTTLVQLLAPVAPHVSEELYREVLGNSESVHLASWPGFDEEMLIEDKKVIGIQVNGKVRGEISVSQDEDEKSVRERVLALDKMQRWLDDKEVQKFMYIPSKIISIVLKS